MIKAIVLEDEWYNLEEVCALVENTGFMHVVGRYLTPLQALEQAPLLRPEVAFIDIDMPEVDGLTCAARLKETVPGILVAFITGWNQYAVQAFDIGAADYIMKPIRQERFDKLIEKLKKELGVHEEEDAVADRCAVRTRDTSDGTGPSLLTEREQQVLLLLSRGLTNKEIAAELFVSISGVKKHLEHIYKKLQVNNKVNAIASAREKRLLP